MHVPCLPSHAPASPSFTFVIAAIQHQLVEYLQKWRAVLPIHFCFFDERYYEWAGSILSAEPLFGESNLVLLPDSFLRPAPGLPLIPTVLDFLSRFGVVFGYVEETRPERLRALGALAVQADSSVSQFCDKPSQELEKFNGFWGCFGFRRASARTLLRTMMRSVAREPVSVADFAAPVGAFALQEYMDLGTWPNVHQAVQAQLFSDGDPRNMSDSSVPRP
eukprot:Tamp_16593.p1 GENE.Tamp_16593~~Tamp_16593.p1  ORF type:complete len:220 (+),score=13.54 Tamp_16593:644-1303(+)